jgi:DNA-directed RNA polymerase specialized sigma24 family protein
MAVDSELIERARKLRPGAVGELLQSQAVSVYRIAYALSGRWDVGRGIARFVLNRSVRMMPKWDRNDDPENWFHRFTVMTSRRSAKHQPIAKKDVLVEQALSPDQAYVAFISALRHLDTQQREALLLRHGEKLNERYSALAMDCSTEAAENHLKAAETSLRLVAGEHYDPMLQKMVDAYVHLTPEPDQLVPAVNRVVLRKVVVRRWGKWLWFLLQLAVLVGMCWGAWKVYRMVQT